MFIGKNNIFHSVLLKFFALRLISNHEDSFQTFPDSGRISPIPAVNISASIPCNTVNIPISFTACFTE